MSLTQTLSDYQQISVFSKGLINSAHRRDTTGSFLWSVDERRVITEAALLKMFVGWETFLEKTFILLLTGHSSTKGNGITKYASPPNEDHANMMLIGLMRYVDWSTPDNVRKLARLFFERGEPFETVLASIDGDLRDLKTIRNAVAHLSSTTSKALDALSSRKLQKSMLDISVYTLVTSLDPNSNTTKSIFESYLDILSAAANQIVSF